MLLHIFYKFYKCIVKYGKCNFCSKIPHVQDNEKYIHAKSLRCSSNFHIK